MRLKYIHIYHNGMNIIILNAVVALGSDGKEDDKVATCTSSIFMVVHHRY